MLEHYEILELEKKWEEHDKKRDNLRFLKDAFQKRSFKFDRYIITLLFIISAAMGGIVWIITSDGHDEISMAQINENIKNIVPAHQNAVEQNTTYSKEDYNIKMPQNTPIKGERAFLNLNDIGIKSSEDTGGFIIKNQYKSEPAEKVSAKTLFSSIPKDEVIDFSNAPLPPKTNLAASKSAVNRDLSNKIIIQTSNLNENRATLEEKFYSTNNILYATMLAEQAYNSGDYDGAIKWALTSNEIDKDNSKSWIIFAKANYKKGRTNDALFALDSFNSRMPSKEVEAVIKQIKNGSL